MSRPLRVEYPGAWYHVMNRGRRKEPIFFQEEDYFLFIKILKQIVHFFGIQIHAYALMPNHYHLLVNTPRGNLSRTMRHLNAVYTQKINKKYKLDGSLFRGRYKSIIVNEEEYLLELVRYIHKNPYRAKLEKNIGEYKWCSHKAYFKKQKDNWLETEYVLGKFGKYEKEAKRKLKEFVLKEESKDLLKRLSSVNWPSILGGDKFKEKIDTMIRGKELDMKEVPEYRRDFYKNYIEKQEDIKVIKKYVSDLLQRINNKDNRLEKRAVIYLLRKEYGLTLVGIGELLGGVSGAAIAKQYKKAEEDMIKQEGCCDKVNNIIKDKRLKV